MRVVQGHSGLLEPIQWRVFHENPTGGSAAAAGARARSESWPESRRPREFEEVASFSPRGRPDCHATHRLHRVSSRLYAPPLHAAAAGACTRFLPGRCRRRLHEELPVLVALGQTRPRFRRSPCATRRCLTLRSSGQPTAWHPGREALWYMLHLAARAPRRRPPLSSNVRPRIPPMCRPESKLRWRR